MSSPEPVTVIAIGPVTNIAAALALEPAIATKARTRRNARFGRLGYGEETPGPIPEYNVVVDVPACRLAFAADWDVTITPLDTCGSVGTRWRALRRQSGAVRVRS